MAIGVGGLEVGGIERSRGGGEGSRGGGGREGSGGHP